jgi:hypothetical protein
MLPAIEVMVVLPSEGVVIGTGGQDGRRRNGF